MHKDRVRCSFATQEHAQETPAGALVTLRTAVVIFMAVRAQVRERMKDVSVLQRRISSTDDAANPIYNKDMI